MNKYFTQLSVAIAPLLATLLPNASGQTIDPATITTQQVVHFSIGADTGENVISRVMATDSAGNHIVGVILSRTGFQQTIRSVVRKYDRRNNLIWSRERTTTSDTGGSYEEWGDGQPPQPVSNYTTASLEVAAIAVDNVDNVYVAYNSYEADCNTPGCRGLARGRLTLVAKFDSSGHFLWRRATPESISDPNFVRLHANSVIKSFDLAADGSSVLLIDNYTRDANNYHQTVVWKAAADGTRVFFQNYGLDNNATAQIGFISTPTALSRDGAGNIFVVSAESPTPYAHPSFAEYMNVIRKLTSTGQFLKERDLPLYPGYDSNNSSAYPTETWSAARADATGNLYVSGDRFRLRPSQSSADRGDANQLVLKFDPSLTQVWRTLGPQATGNSSGQPRVVTMDLALSKSGTADGVTVGGWWEAGGTKASDENDHWEASRYAFDDGRLIWHRLYQAPSTDANYGFGDRMTAFRLDAQGNVYGQGFVSQPAGNAKPALIKYSSAGDLQFVKLLPDGANYLFSPNSTLKPTFLGLVGKEVVVTEMSNPAVVAAKPDVFGNISTRVRVGGGDNVLIGGFIVNGAQGSTKKVLVRAIGPSLNAFGLAGLADPVLELHDSAGNIITNDNWQEGGTFNQQPYASQKSEIEGASLAPSDLKEAAIIATVPAGNSTAIIRSKTFGERHGSD